MNYIENPKTKGSGILCAIPQQGVCPVGCADCFFQSGRSYLEPLNQNLPNIPTPERAKGFVVRINDGNDSNVHRSLVEASASLYDDAFFNTSIPNDLGEFPGPVVLTVNPAGMTDKRAHWVDPCPQNIMFVRFRVNTWNLDLAHHVVKHYAEERKVPVVLTFMAYYGEEIPDDHRQHYTWRKRTLNSYWVITPEAWEMVMEKFRYSPLVYSCGKDSNTFACARCGNCIREYFVAKVRKSETV